VIGFGLAGVALVMGLTLGAFALAGPDIGHPVPPAQIVRPSGSPSQTKSPVPEHPNDGNRSDSPSPDHLGGSGGVDDHGGTSSGSGTGSSGSGDGSTSSGSGSGSGSGSDDHGGSSSGDD
jgi:hypothetical protein